MAGGEWRVASGEDAAEKVRSYRDLKVWRASLQLAEAVYRLSARWPRDERFGLTSQARRAAVSVAANVAEGAARRTTGEFLQFLGIARGSLAETETLFILSGRLAYTPEGDLADLLDEADEVSRMLAGLVASLKPRR